MSEHFVIVRLQISADEYLKVYKGIGKNVIARDVQGRTVQFPARALQSFVTRDGISGTFKICFDSEGKLQGALRLG